MEKREPAEEKATFERQDAREADAAQAPQLRYRSPREGKDRRLSLSRVQLKFNFASLSLSGCRSGRGRRDDVDVVGLRCED